MGRELGQAPWLYWHPHIGKFGVPPTDEAMGNVFITQWVSMYNAYADE